MKKKAFKAAFPHTIPIFLGYLFLGIAFGVSLTSKGYHFMWAILMSLTIYAGSGQFLGVNLLAGGANIINTAVMTFMVNARHLFYGLSMLGKFKGMGKKKPYMIFSLTDETYSLLCSTKAPEGVDEKWFCFFIALLDQSYWVFGSTIGALAGSFIKFDSTGIDFAMTALFVVIFVEQWETVKNHIPALIGVVVSVIALLLVGPDNFIVLSMVFMLALLLGFRQRIEGRTHT